MLIDKIIKFLREHRNNTVSDWDIANDIYDNCMNYANKSNGARISNIRMACHKSEKIGQSNSGWFLIK